MVRATATRIYHELRAQGCRVSRKRINAVAASALSYCLSGCLSGRLFCLRFWFWFSQQSVQVALDVIDEPSSKRLQQKTESYIEPDFRTGHVHLAIDT